MEGLTLKFLMPGTATLSNTQIQRRFEMSNVTYLIMKLTAMSSCGNKTINWNEAVDEEASDSQEAKEYPKLLYLLNQPVAQLFPSPSCWRWNAQLWVELSRAVSKFLFFQICSLLGKLENLLMANFQPSFLGINHLHFSKTPLAASKPFVIWNVRDVN